MILPGSRLGPYEIVASIGAGGMGEVFRARDTRLNRDVAVKILPADFAGTAQLHARFDREAKAIAALNHPNICVVHDVGHEDETHYLVMELLDGESLVDRLRRGPLSMPEVLRYGQQIASALDKAHRQGIIHRDLKPGNIMLTRSGAKLLDFGLAKITESAPSTQSMATAQKPITEQGAILGTFQYMAPEQLEGLDADPRTDIFALGAVLYEMATGKRAFQGTSRTSLIAAIVASQPQPVSELVPMTPPAFEHVVRRCLEKNPDDRWQSAQDVASELQWVSEVTASGTHAITAGIARSKWRKFAAPALVVAALLAGLALGWSLRKPAAVLPNAPSIQSEVPLPPGLRLFGWGSPSIAISPDGQTIAYVATDAQGPQRLYIRHLSRSDAIAIPGSESAEGPFFSPDGKWVGYAVGVSGFAVNLPPELRKVSIDGGLPQTICPLDDFFGATWGGDGNIYFVNGAGRGLWRVAAVGGAPALITPKDLDVTFPSVLPDGQSVVAVADGKIAIIHLADGKVERLPVMGMMPSYVATGHLLYTGPDRTLTALPFDRETGKITGGGAALVDDIAISGIEGPMYAVSKNGTLVYVQGFVSGSTRELTRLVRMTRSGTATALPFPPGTYSRRGISVSRDGTRAAVTMWDGKVWICDLKRGTHLSLPQETGIMRVSPLWTPDSKAVVFTAFGAGLDAMHVYLQPVDGGEQARLVTGGFERPFEAWPTGWLDDDTLLFNHYTDASPMIAAVSISGADQKPRALLRQEGMTHLFGRVSPDRQWIVYQARERERHGIYVRRSDLQGVPVLVAASGMEARWSADGKEIVFRNGDQVLAAPFAGGDPGEPRELFKVEGLKTFDVIPGSTDFALIVEEAGSGVKTRISMVQNWVF